MDGLKSNIYYYFKSLLVKGLLEARKHVDSFVKIIDIMSRGAPMPCFNNTNKNEVKNKFFERFLLNRTDNDIDKTVNEMIDNSYDNWRTNQYDNFQRLTNDIRP
jgi:phosphatidylinositol 4-kinase